MEEDKKKIKDLNMQLQHAKFKLDMLTRYIIGKGDVFHDLCKGIDENRCPFGHPPDDNNSFCSACIIRNISTMLLHAGLIPKEHIMEKIYGDQAVDAPYCQEDIPPEELPFEVDMKKWGEIKSADLIDQGIYILSGSKSDLIAVVKEEADKIFSSKVLTYGVEYGGAVFFPALMDRWNYCVLYELQRYLMLHSLSFPSFGTLREIALIGAEEYPLYFGASLPPIDTPYGRMTRYIELEPGIYFIETEKCNQLLAISVTIWDCELTQDIRDRAEMTADNMLEGNGRTLGYMFWDKEECAIPLYELLRNKLHPELKRFIVSETAVLAAIWKYAPEYAIKNNLLEQTYSKEAVEVTSENDAERPSYIIPYAPDTQESEFLKLPDSWRLD